MNQNKISSLSRRGGSRMHGGMSWLSSRHRLGGVFTSSLWCFHLARSLQRIGMMLWPLHLLQILLRTLCFSPPYSRECLYRPIFLASVYSRDTLFSHTHTPWIKIILLYLVYCLGLWDPTVNSSTSAFKILKALSFSLRSCTAVYSTCLTSSKKFNY